MMKLKFSKFGEYLAHGHTPDITRLGQWQSNSKVLPHSDSSLSLQQFWVHTESSRVISTPRKDCWMLEAQAMINGASLRWANLLQMCTAGRGSPQSTILVNIFLQSLLFRLSHAQDLMQSPRFPWNRFNPCRRLWRNKFTPLFESFMFCQNKQSLGAVKQRLSPNDLKPEGTWVLILSCQTHMVKGRTPEAGLVKVWGIKAYPTI